MLELILINYGLTKILIPKEINVVLPLPIFQFLLLLTFCFDCFANNLLFLKIASVLLDINLYCSLYS